MNELLRVTNLHGESHLLGVKKSFFEKDARTKIHLSILVTGIKKAFVKAQMSHLFLRN